MESNHCDLSPGASSDAGPAERRAPDPQSATGLILRFARLQQGVVARAQLLDAGLRPRQVDLRVNRGLLVPVARGVYGVGHDIISRRARLRAALLSAGPGAALSHWSAAAVWGVAAPRDRVEVVRTHSRKVRSNRHATEGSATEGSVTAGSATEGGATEGSVTEGSATEGSVMAGNARSWIFVHRSRLLDPTDLAVRDGFAITAFTRTMIDLAARLDEDRIRSILREAERLRIADWRELRRETASGRGRKGIAGLRAVVAEWTGADSATRSNLELRFLSLCRGAGLPLPIVNGSVSGFEVDCYWPGSRLAVELDGYESHRGRPSFESDRQRDLVLARAGLQVLRVTHRMLRDRPDTLLDLLKGRLRGGEGRRPGG